MALLPDGRVEFIHPAVQPLIDMANDGRADGSRINFDDYVIRDPLVRMNQFHLAAPAIAFIETTNLCNLRCKHCYAFSGHRRKKEMSTEVILRLLDEFAELGVLQVFLTGGEVFAHPDAVRIIQHSRTKPFSTQVFTNGLLITEEKLSKIPPGQSFFISFDTAEPTRTIRGKMDFPKLRQRFEWMKKYGHVLRTAVSVHNHNIEDVEEIFEWCAQHGYPRPQWLETHPIGRALLHPDIILRPEQVERVFAIYKRCMDRYSVPPAAMTNGDMGNHPPQENGNRIRSIQTIKFCQRLERATNREKCARSLVYVSSNGDVYPCSNCMSNKMHCGGNLSSDSFRNIWEKGFEEVRAITFDDFVGCAQCPVYQADIWCQFRCPPLAANVSGNDLGCGATEYLRRFMLLSGEYWAKRRRDRVGLTLLPPVYSGQDAPLPKL